MSPSDAALIAAAPCQIDILGTDGLTYRFFGINFVTAATTVADVGGTGIWLVDVWTGAHRVLALRTPGYQARADLVILLGSASSLGGLTTADFV